MTEEYTGTRNTRGDRVDRCEVEMGVQGGREGIDTGREKKRLE